MKYIDYAKSLIAMAISFVVAEIISALGFTRSENGKIIHTPNITINGKKISLFSFVGNIVLAVVAIRYNILIIPLAILLIKGGKKWWKADRVVYEQKEE